MLQIQFNKCAWEDSQSGDLSKETNREKGQSFKCLLLNCKNIYSPGNAEVLSSAWKALSSLSVSKRFFKPRDKGKSRQLGLWDHRVLNQNLFLHFCSTSKMPKVL